MKKIIVIFFLFFLTFIQVNALTLPKEVDITADAIVLLNLDADEIIYTKILIRKKSLPH